MPAPERRQPYRRHPRSLDEEVHVGETIRVRVLAPHFTKQVLADYLAAQPDLVLVRDAEAADAVVLAGSDWVERMAGHAAGHPEDACAEPVLVFHHPADLALAARCGVRAVAG